MTWWRKSTIDPARGTISRTATAPWEIEPDQVQWVAGEAIVNGQTPLSLADIAVKAEVARETGKVDVLRFTTLQDVGRAIHPAYVEGQMEGGAVCWNPRAFSITGCQRPQTCR